MSYQVKVVKGKQIRNWIITSLFIAVSCFAAGQTSHLSKKITVGMNQVMVAEALGRIATNGGFHFSYDASLIDGSKRITVNANNAPVREVLNQVVGKEIRIQEIGNHVILMPPRQETQKSSQKITIRISGILGNAETREPVENATIFEINKRANGLSGPNGQYMLELPAGQALKGINFSREGYRDTVIFIRPSEDIRQDILLLPVDPIFDPLSARQAEFRISAVDSSRLITWLVPTKTRIHSKNMQILRNRTFQVSLIPYIGTNGSVTGSVANRFSFNLFAGYTRGTDGFELGGLVNINRNFLRGFQLAGFGNYVGPEATGFQLGGLFNIDRGTFRGAQVAGLVNFLSDSLSGAQIGGLCNITGNTNRGAQVAGLTNYTRYNKGFQLAGLVNIAYKVNEGAQVAGLLNYTKRLKGFQLAVFNVVNTVESGVPVGFLSIVTRNGYYRFEVSADEIFYGNIGFRGGTERFYNIFRAGIGDDYMTSFTYGIGTMFHIGKKVSLCLDLTTGAVITTQAGWKYHGLLEKLAPTLDISLGRRTALSFGPTANLYWFNKDNTVKPDGISFYTLMDESFSDTSPHRLQFWIGGTLGLKF